MIAFDILVGEISNPAIPLSIFLDEDSGEYMMSDEMPKMQIHAMFSPLAGTRNPGMTQFVDLINYKPELVGIPKHSDIYIKRGL